MTELMILFVLLKRDLTMYSIRKHIQEIFLAFTNPSFGAIKPALVRLEKSNRIKSSKIMSDGGKLSVFYSITQEGMRELKDLLLKPFSVNPLQFVSEAKIRICCASFLDKNEIENLFEEIKSNAVLHRMNAEKIIENEFTNIDFYQRIVLDNTICEYKNLISMIEGLEKNNARNSK